MKAFFTKGLEFISAVSLKRTPMQSVSYMGSAQQPFLNYQSIFKTFSDKVAGFFNNNVFDKNI